MGLDLGEGRLMRMHMRQYGRGRSRYRRRGGATIREGDAIKIDLADQSANLDIPVTHTDVA